MNLQSNIRKRRGLTGPQLFEGTARKDRVNFFREVGGNFYMKNKIKSEVFDNKKGQSKNIFLYHNQELKVKLENFN